MARWFCRFPWCPRNDALDAANDPTQSLAPYVVVRANGQVQCANPVCYAPVVLPSNVLPSQLPQSGQV